MKKKLLKLALVGRPNVGKSALFNRICKKRIAIVDEQEGVTRDRLYAGAELFGYPFEVIDTGGIDTKSKADFNEHIKRQAEIAIIEADALVMVVDAHIGVTPLDHEVAKILLKTNKPVSLAINKVDNPAQESLTHEFHSLGIAHQVPVSATHNWHIAELLETAFRGLDKNPETIDKDPSIRLAIVGRPNVGKSSLVNTLLSEERCIVSPIAGTTRDSIDIPFLVDDTPYLLIDTAGIKRKNKESDVVDKFAHVRTENAIERADVCLLMLDANQGMTAQEKKIANDIEASGKGCIILFNKWDLVKGFRMEHCLQGIEKEVPFLKHCPKLFISAKFGRNLEKIFPIVKEVYEASQRRISTGQLNKFVERAQQLTPPAMIQGKRLRIYYMTQVDIAPPKFVLFINYPTLLMDSYKKYLINRFRENFEFPGVPLEFHLKGKKQRDLPHLSE